MPELTDDIRYLPGVGEKRRQMFARLGIKTLYDLLTYYPRAYDDITSVTPIARLTEGSRARVAATVMMVTSEQTRRGLALTKAQLSDGSGFLQAIWWGQPHIAKTLHVGERILVVGKVGYAYGSRGLLAMSPVTSYEKIAEGGVPQKSGFTPIYRTVGNIKQSLIIKTVKAALKANPAVPELLPEEIRRRYSLLPRGEALAKIHFPSDSATLAAARRRLAFEELYLIQCGLLLLKKQSQEKNRGIRHLANSQLVKQVTDGLPFQLTGDQQAAWQEIIRDMEKPLPMRRLIQGDVGSGKTVLALLALTKTVENGYQGALMAPTEILAHQHYDSFARMLEGTGVRVGFLSGSLTPKQRETIYGKIAAHEVDIVIGTHALIQEGVTFAALGLAVTDEQHRFGVLQRADLEKKGTLQPDALVLTATPIPRTMTLTVYGDLDVSLIRELPPGRRQVRTFLRQKGRRELIYKFVHDKLQEGRQAYVVCPLIEKNEELPLPSAEEIFAELSKGKFRDMPCGLVHGKLKASEKDRLMQDFYEDKIKLLVATTDIEVGVNVPNASIMVVEHAERFGLSQLHQLRGRIGRGEWQSYCILVSDSRSDTARERLSLMEHISDGFSLAEEDLRLRGPGQFFGSMQHGLPDLKIADVLKDTATLIEARKAALACIADPVASRAIIPALAAYRADFASITDT